MEYRLDIELITGWWSLGGFQLGYKHDVNRVIEETRKLIENPVSGYQTDEKLQECKLFLSRVKTAVLQHEWGPNCNDKEKQESITLIDSFVKEIEGLKSIWDIERKKDEKQPAKQIKTDLTNDQRAELADLFAEAGFIPAADKTALIEAIGGKIEGNRVEPVKWLKNKQLLREFLTSLKGFSDLRTTDIEHLCPELFTDLKGNPINLANNKVVPCTDSDKIKGYFKKIATI